MNIHFDYVKIFSYLIFCILIIFIYGNYRCNNPEYNDILQTSIGVWDLDGWSLSHLLFFTFIGYQCVNGCKNTKYLILAFIAGVIWELFEYYYGKKRPDWLGGNCNSGTDKKGEKDVWWYAKSSDIIMNLLGLLIGYYLKNKTLPFKLPFLK